VKTSNEVCGIDRKGRFQFSVYTADGVKRLRACALTTGLASSSRSIVDRSQPIYDSEMWENVAPNITANACTFMLKGDIEFVKSRHSSRRSQQRVSLCRGGVDR
jgi:hypothetical protein